MWGKSEGIKSGSPREHIDEIAGSCRKEAETMTGGVEGRGQSEKSCKEPQVLSEPTGRDMLLDTTDGHLSRFFWT